jgi:prepilin-type N-terminal cleavage/methylation domain-containing protein
MHNQLERLRDKREVGEGGFTLIELLIVIVILGILAAIVVFSVTGINNTSAQSACKADVATVNTAAEAYYAQNGAPAGTIGALVSAGLLHADSTWTTALPGAVTIGTGANAITVTYATGGTNPAAGNATGTVGAATC